MTIDHHASETGVVDRIKCRSGLERTVMEYMVPGSRYRHQPAWSWTQDSKDTLNVKMQEVGELTTDVHISNG